MRGGEYAYGGCERVDWFRCSGGCGITDEVVIADVKVDVDE